MSFEKLQCEYRDNPIGLDVLTPRLMWTFSFGKNSSQYIQSGSHVLVASSQELAETMVGDIWDSGETSSEKPFLEYAGSALVSLQRYYWRVAIRNQEGGWLPYSEIATFEMGILDSALWKGCWVGPYCATRAVELFRTTAMLHGNIARARVYLATCGYSELWVNGSRMGDSVLEPANTDYRKRVFYLTYDVTKNLRAGENALGIRLNRGWAEHEKFLFQLYVWYTDGTMAEIHSCFGEWMMMLSAIRSATIYSGEVYTGLYERPEWNLPGPAFEERYHLEPWIYLAEILPEKIEENPPQYYQYGLAYYDVPELPAPEGKLQAQLMEPIQPMEVIQPKNVRCAADKRFIFDFEQNFAGWIRLRFYGKANQRVIIRYTELLDENGNLNMEYLRISDPTYPFPMQTDSVMPCVDGWMEYEPCFTYHGFRYVEIEGAEEAMTLDNVLGIVVHSSLMGRGSFRSSEPLLNRLHEAVLWTERSNLYGIPTDCPQRSERQGWLNDVTVRLETTLYNFDSKLFFSKFERDIADTQDGVSGAIADTAPFRRGNFPGDPTCSCYVLLPYLVYMHFDDIRELSEHYEGAKKWTEYLGRNSRKGILPFSMYGDWASPKNCCEINGMNTPVSAITTGTFISSGYYYFNLRLLEKMADILGFTQEKGAWIARADMVREEINRHYFHADTANYLKGSQGANTFGLYLGLVPAGMERRVVENLKQDILAKEYHLTTGSHMTKYIFEVLCEYGEVDVAYRLVRQTTYPSWGFMLGNEATTIWERWENATGYDMNSHNHPMYGTIDAWFYKYLAGIQPLEPGFRKVRIRPYIPTKLDAVSTTLQTLYGGLSVCWEKHADGLEIELTIPSGVTAIVDLPLDVPSDSAVFSNGKEMRSDTTVFQDQKSGVTYFQLTLSAGDIHLEVRSRSNLELHEETPALMVTF